MEYTKQLVIEYLIENFKYDNDEITEVMTTVYIDEETQKIHVSYHNSWTDSKEKIIITTIELVIYMFKKMKEKGLL